MYFRRSQWKSRFRGGAILVKGYSSKHKTFLLCNDEFGIRPGINIKKLKKVHFDFIFDLIRFIPKYLL